MLIDFDDGRRASQAVIVEQIAAIRRCLDDGPEVRREAIGAGRRLGLADLPVEAAAPDPAATAPGPARPVDALARRR